MPSFKEPSTIFFPNPSGKRETEAFNWIRREWEFSKYVMRIDFSYQDGFEVKFIVPLEWDDNELMDVAIEAKHEFNEKFKEFEASKFS